MPSANMSSPKVRRSSPSTDNRAGGPVMLREAARRAVARLSFLSAADARLEIELLLAHVLGCERSALLTHPECALSETEAQALDDLLQRRVAREPIQYLLGTAAFRDFEVRVDPRVLIPRPETEELVEAALARMPHGGGVTFCDVGTGSGCIAIALARALPTALGTATDASADALALARENARACGVADRVSFLQGDLLTPAVDNGRIFDMICSNPPYVAAAEVDALQPEVRLFEPRAALVAGEGGTLFYRRLLAEAPAALAPGGWLVMELADAVCERVVDMVRENPAWGCRDVVRDVAGVDRILAVKRKVLWRS